MWSVDLLAPVRRFDRYQQSRKWLAIPMAQTGHCDAAIEAARHDLTLAPDSYDLKRLLGALLEQAGQNAEAQRYQQKAQEIQKRMKAQLAQPKPVMPAPPPV